MAALTDVFNFFDGQRHSNDEISLEELIEGNSVAVDFNDDGVIDPDELARGRAVGRAVSVRFVALLLDIDAQRGSSIMGDDAVSRSEYRSLSNLGNFVTRIYVTGPVRYASDGTLLLTDIGLNLMALAEARFVAAGL